jgi:hypothetical protein
MDDQWRGFELAVCRWIVGLTMSEELPDAAVAAIVAGCDSSSLAQLAGMDDATWSQFPPVVAEIFEQRGRPLPSGDEAMKTLGDDLLHQIAARKLAVREGIRELDLLWQIVRAEDPAHDELETLNTFGSALEYADDVTGNYGEPEPVEAAALEAVKVLIARGGLPVA